jgi:phospholipase D1/2
VSSRFRPAAVLRVGALPLMALAATFIAWKSGYFELDRRRELAQLVQNMRQIPGAELMYLGAYAVVAALCLPVVIMTIIGGAFFGPIFGPLFAWTGALFGTVVAHTLAARVAQAPLRRMFGQHRLLRQLKDDVGFVGLFRLRILPVAPFGIFAYVAGIAGVRLMRLLSATAVAMVPSMVAYGYVGAELMRGLSSDPDAAGRALRVAGYVTLGMLAVSVVPSIVRKFRNSE